tara:strand:- start:1167 stop:1358 length:192 start_codon:yes stop_codon:yes gene_type:complete
MQHDEVKPGDVVQLKSGGRSMTAGKDVLNNAKSLTCYWFEDGELRKSDVPKMALTLITLRSGL